LFDGCVEGIEVGMEDRRFHPSTFAGPRDRLSDAEEEGDLRDLLASVVAEFASVAGRNLFLLG
jgi:hypothetical protein